jgi:hypothetical protein
MPVRTSLTTARPQWLAGLALSPRLRFVFAVLLAVTLIVVAYIVLGLGRPDAAGQESLRAWLDRLHAEGKLPGFVTFGLVEWSANVVLFLPIGLFFAGALRPLRRIWVVPIAAAMSSAIELSQKFWLPSRVASVGDVLANTTGALLGVLILLAVSRWSRQAGF